MEDYEKDLLADFESSDEELNEELQVDEEEGEHDEIQNTNKTPLSFQQKLNDIISANAIADSFQTILSTPDIENVEDWTKLSRIYSLIPELQQKIDQFSNEQESDYLELLSSLANENDSSDEYKFILSVNELSTIITNEINVFCALIKMQYKVVFPELETLIMNPIDYVRLILTFRQDLKNIKSYEQDMKKIITNEKVLVVIMAALQQIERQFVLSDSDMTNIVSCGLLVLELDDILRKLSGFIATKLSKLAPNVSAIVGPITTSQLLIATGSLKQLALTPSCNVASLGVRDLSSTTKVASRTIAQTGYLYHCDIVKYLPPDIVRSVMRIISGKVILAARIDLSKSSPDGEIGAKYLQEIQEKVDKLLTPPDQVPDKALPVPIEQKSKKRGGRRFRKMKERFQMSELRKAQNKLEFGKEEDTVMDSFGEEIGLGMSRSAGVGMGRIGQIKVNTNTSARMSKSMIHRLQKQQEDSKQFNKAMLEDESTLVFSKPASSSNTTNPQQQKNPIAKSRWLTGINKRKLNEDSVNGNSTKQPRIQQNSQL
ncbi:PRP31 [[Candida] subhashii]|uniref:PRP31 n=1 Tax=[Candida] subhashii TaxID=561895 RepID=A0A8J5Q4E2_9ASCO|nr:PRP31 [[Candida] subhashii]KAG7661469.1 PRP31 [[Candida] subhashii]